MAMVVVLVSTRYPTDDLMALMREIDLLESRYRCLAETEASEQEAILARLESLWTAVETMIGEIGEPGGWRRRIAVL